MAGEAIFATSAHLTRAASTATAMARVGSASATRTGVEYCAIRTSTTAELTSPAKMAALARTPRRTSTDALVPKAFPDRLAKKWTTPAPRILASMEPRVARLKKLRFANVHQVRESLLSF